MPERARAWAWLALWLTTTVLAIALATPWQWLPGDSLPAIDPDAGLDAVTLARIADYRTSAVRVGLTNTALGLLVSAGLGLTPLGARLVARLPGRRHRAVHRVVAVAVLVGIGTLATLPLRMVAEHLARRAGLSTRTWASWAADVATSYAVTAVVTSLVLLALAGVAARVRPWQLCASLGAGALVLLGSLAYPVVIEPLYASFSPMPAGALRTSLVELATRDGIDVDEVLVADASRRTTAVNAYVSGFGPTRRIVVYDTLLAQATPREVRLVVAHELGHAASDDVLRGSAIGAAGAVAGVTAMFLMAGSPVLRRRSGIALAADGGREPGPGAGGGHVPAAVEVAEPQERVAHRGGAARHTVTAVTGVPLLLALSTLGSFAVLPVTNAVSRAVEARADVHALALTQDPEGFVAMQRRLAVSNLSDPSPPTWRQVWFATHPSPAQRLALAQGWVARHSQVQADQGVAGSGEIWHATGAAATSR